MISEEDKRLILEEWKNIPLAPNPFAAYYIETQRNVKGRISKNEIVSFLKSSVEYSSLKQKKTHKTERFFYDHLKPFSTLFLDSMYMLNAGVSGGQYVFVAVDGFTNMMYFRAMNRLTGKSAAYAFASILTETGKVDKVLTDNGSEFVSQPFQKLLTEHSIKHITTKKSFLNKSWKAERGIRTLRNMLGRQMQMGSRRHLPELLRTAQETINSTPGPIPGLPRNQITASNASEYINRLRDKEFHSFKFSQETEKFQIGQTVLLKLPQGPFHKSNHPNFGDTIYLIVGVKPGTPLEGYRLENLYTGERLEGSYSIGLLTPVTHKLPERETTKIIREEGEKPLPSQRVTRSQTRLKNDG